MARIFVNGDSLFFNTNKSTRRVKAPNGQTRVGDRGPREMYINTSFQKKYNSFTLAKRAKKSARFPSALFTSLESLIWAGTVSDGGL